MKKITNLLLLTCLLFGILMSNSCKKDKSLAVLTTTNVTAISVTSATSGGNITNSGGADVTARGVCWNTSRSPVIAGFHTADGTGSGSFSSSITGLTANTQYYVRAYATNSVGTAYGNEVAFTTSEIVAPTVTTTAASAILLTTATVGGNVTADGGASVSARGVCWSTTADPDITGTKTSDGTGTGTFESHLTELTPATVYHIRAYATNSAGTSYGTDMTFTTASIIAPTVTTTATVTEVTLTSGNSGGSVTSDGGATVTARGVCYATTTNPVVTGEHTSNGTGTGVFTSELSGLTPGTTYYVRAYATNSVGTGYGLEVTFVTADVAAATVTTAEATAVTYTSATSGGDVTADGGGTVTAKGICYATTTQPTTASSIVAGGTGLGAFISNITGLTPGTMYYVRAYATNSHGTAYGTEITFTTPTVVVPTVSTVDATGVTQTTATTGGNVTAEGGGEVTAKGVCYSLTAVPLVTDLHTTNGTGLGAFVSGITGLTPNTLYHVRAYATNSAGTGYGLEITFTTGAIIAPTLSTTIASDITQTTAATGGDISSDGGAAVTARGVCYSITANPTTSNSITTDGTGEGVFTSALSLLTPGTMYYVRAYATNSAGTAYGNEISFTTNGVLNPTVTTADPTAVALTTATSGGNVTSEGGGAVTARGIVYATTHNPTTSNTVITTGSGLGIFTSNITGLTPGTQYFIRAYATNSAGTSYGNEVTLNTNIADVDGNTYRTVTIGTQVWMAENLKTTLYNTAVAIPLITLNATWAAATTPAYSWYANTEATYKPLYGALYNWYAANNANVCPDGWHVPAESEFSTLELTLGMDQAVIPNWGPRGTDQGAQLKNTTGWAAGQNGTNTSGFSALPGGYRYNADGTFNNVGVLTYFWATDELDAARGWYRRLDGAASTVDKGATEKQAGKYIRCVKD